MLDHQVYPGRTFPCRFIPFIRVEEPVPIWPLFWRMPWLWCSNGRLIPKDLDWNHHGSFQCSTPLTRASGTLPDAGSFDYARVFFKGCLCISALDSNVVDATTAADLTTVTDTLQELDITKPRHYHRDSN